MKILLSFYENRRLSIIAAVVVLAQMFINPSPAMPSECENFRHPLKIEFVKEEYEKSGRDQDVLHKNSTFATLQGIEGCLEQLWRQQSEILQRIAYLYEELLALRSAFNDSIR